jgi:murein DD-endopeptidase MepM/ murein hydrolase activator NlpD
MEMNWLIAIHSVNSNNETPTTAGIKDFTKNLFSTGISEEITSRHEETDEDGNVTHTTLYIDRTLTQIYMDPYSLMNKLGFTREQIAWAETMYSFLAGVEPNSSYEIGLISDADFINPLPIAWRGVVTSEFGYRLDPISGDPSNHTGIDFAAARGTDIRAVKGGTVVSVVHGETDYGYFVKISHGGGLETMYAHCNATLVAVGDEVEQGDIVGKVGSTGKSTGNHLHFEVRINGRAVNPRPWLP